LKLLAAAIEAHPIAAAAVAAAPNLCG